MPHPPAASPGRLFFADWLRIGAFVLLVLYHVGMFYVPWGWHVKHSPTYPALEPWMRLSNPWRMSLLFMVSGLATGLMLGRPALLRQRTRRLLLPLLFGVAVIVPPQAWLQVREQFGYTGSYGAFLGLYFTAYAGFCRDSACLVLPTWNHLWFLPYLWCYTALLLTALRLLPPQLLGRGASTIGRLSGWPLLVGPALLLGAVRAVLLPRFGETHALIDDAWAHATYLPIFAFGVVLARRRPLMLAMEALRWPALACALAAWLAGVAASADTIGASGRPEALGLALRFMWATQQWCAIVAAFGFAHRHLNVDHRWRAPLTEAVFPLYLVHQTIIIVGAVALRPLALNAGVEAAVLVALAFGGGLLAWQAARRLAPLQPWMGLPRRRAIT